MAQQLAAASSASTLAATASAAPFSVQMRRVRAQTIDGMRTVETVIATRPENLSGQIVLLAHRDASQPGSAAELSGTAALLELQRRGRLDAQVGHLPEKAWRLGRARSSASLGTTSILDRSPRTAGSLMRS